MMKQSPFSKFGIIRVTGSFYPKTGGLQTHVLELSQKISPNLDGQILIVPDYDLNSNDFDKKSGIMIERVKFNLFPDKMSNFFGITILNNFFYAINSSEKIVQLINSGQKVDIIHIHGIILGEFITFFLQRIKKISIPIIIMSHGMPVLLHQNLLSRILLRKFQSFLFDIVKPDFFIQLDDGTIEESFLQELERKKIPTGIVYHAIDTDIYSPNPRENNGNFIILSPHRLEKFKNIEISIHIFKKMLQKTPNSQFIKLKLIGGGSEKEIISNLITKENLTENVEVCGELDAKNIIKEYNSADIIIGTSLISNTNRSIQEAMSCEKPVIVFNSGRSMYKLIDHLTDGILVNNGDENEFVDQLIHLLQNPDLRDKLGKNARIKIQNSRNWDSRIKKELEIYSQMIKKP